MQSNKLETYESFVCLHAIICNTKMNFLRSFPKISSNKVKIPFIFGRNWNEVFGSLLYLNTTIRESLSQFENRIMARVYVRSITRSSSILLAETGVCSVWAQLY